MFLKIPLSIHKEIQKPVFFGSISLPSYILNGDGILSPFSPISLPSRAKNKSLL